MTGSLRTHVNGAISIWSYRVTPSPLLRSAKRPAWDRVLPNAVVAQTPSSETVNSLYRPNRQPIPSVRSYIRIDADNPRARRGSRARTELYSSTHPVGRDSRCPILGLFQAILLDREARHEIREAPRRGARNQPEAREGQAGRSGVAERFVVCAGQRMNRRVKVPPALG
jgi:hypothetical protein